MKAVDFFTNISASDLKPTVDLDQFYNKVKFVNLGFSTGKSESC